MNINVFAFRDYSSERTEKSSSTVYAYSPAQIAFASESDNSIVMKMVKFQ